MTLAGGAQRAYDLGREGRTHDPALSSEESGRKGQSPPLPPFYGYHRCIHCCFGRHEDCDGMADIHHVGGAVEEVACVCFEVEHRA